LLVLGRRGLIGKHLDLWFGFSLPFTTAGVVVAEAFVAMPFLVISVEGALRAADPRYEEAPATLGASRWLTFRRVTLPSIAPGHRGRRRTVLGPPITDGQIRLGDEVWDEPPRAFRSADRRPIGVVF
jgi:ABC-type uncharacterized transport system permease subunit